MWGLLWAEAFESQSPHVLVGRGFLLPFPHRAGTPRAPQGGGPGTQGCDHSKPGRGTKTPHVPAQRCSHCSPSQVVPLGRAVLAVAQGARGGAGVWSRVPSTPKPLSCTVWCFWCCCGCRGVGGWVVFAHLSSLAVPCTGGCQQALPPWLAVPRMICGGAGSNGAWREHCFPAAHADLCK